MKHKGTPQDIVGKTEGKPQDMLGTTKENLRKANEKLRNT